MRPILTCNGYASGVSKRNVPARKIGYIKARLGLKQDSTQLLYLEKGKHLQDTAMFSMRPSTLANRHDLKKTSFALLSVARTI